MTYMAQYHAGTMEILHALRGELAQIGALSSRAAEVIRVGGRVWTSMHSGHLPRFETHQERRGNPGLIVQHDDFAVLEPGDMVFTNFCHREVLAARRRGVYVVCVTTPYRDNEFRPTGFTDLSHGNPDGLMLGDVSDEVLHTHMPYQQGLVDCAEIPEFTLCPCAATGTGGVHWMLVGEVEQKLADLDAPEGGKARQYLEVLTERAGRTAAHMDAIEETALTMAERILAGGRWFARSLEHPGLQTEFQVASGPRVVNYGDWDAAPDQNIMLISAISPAFPEEVALAREKREQGAFVIAIGPAALDGVVPEEGLGRIADVAFDNFSPESGGAVEIAGRAQTICPTSAIVDNVIQQMISAQWAEEMIGKGTVPTFLRGVYQTGGAAYNSAMTERFAERGY